MLKPFFEVHSLLQELNSFVAGQHIDHGAMLTSSSESTLSQFFFDLATQDV